MQLNGIDQQLTKADGWLEIAEPGQALHAHWKSLCFISVKTSQTHDQSNAKKLKVKANG